MKLITRHTAYAVGAILFAAKSKQDIISVEEFYKGTRIPKAFLRKILQILSKRNIFSSFKGKQGGFRLRKNSNQISLIDIADIFQEGLKINECFFKKKLCDSEKNCALKKKIDDIERMVVKELESITIASLLNYNKRRRLK